MEEKLEIRYLQPEEEPTFRAFEEDGKRFISGYAAVYNTPSKLLFERGQLFYEIIERGAFDKVLASQDLDVVYNFNHMPEKMIARSSNGTLELISDDKGLLFRAEVPDGVTYAEDMFKLIQRGTLSRNSFAFIPNKETITLSRNEKGDLIRKIKEVSQLRDVATVINPAYSESNVIWARGITEFIESETETIESEDRRKALTKEEDELLLKIKLIKIKNKQNEENK